MHLGLISALSVWPLLGSPRPTHHKLLTMSLIRSHAWRLDSDLIPQRRLCVLSRDGGLVVYPRAIALSVHSLTSGAILRVVTPLTDKGAEIVAVCARQDSDAVIVYRRRRLDEVVVAGDSHLHGTVIRTISLLRHDMPQRVFLDCAGARIVAKLDSIIFVFGYTSSSLVAFHVTPPVEHPKPCRIVDRHTVGQPCQPSLGLTLFDNGTGAVTHCPHLHEAPGGRHVKAFVRDAFPMNRWGCWRPPGLTTFAAVGDGTFYTACRWSSRLLRVNRAGEILEVCQQYHTGIRTRSPIIEHIEVLSDGRVVLQVHENATRKCRVLTPRATLRVTFMAVACLGAALQ